MFNFQKLFQMKTETIKHSNYFGNSFMKGYIFHYAQVNMIKHRSKNKKNNLKHKQNFLSQFLNIFRFLPPTVILTRSNRNN